MDVQAIDGRENGGQTTTDITTESSPKSSGKGMEKSQNVVDSVVEDGVEIPSANSMAKQLNTSSRTIQRELAYLRTKGRIQRIDGDFGGHWEVIEN